MYQVSCMKEVLTSSTINVKCTIKNSCRYRIFLKKSLNQIFSSQPALLTTVVKLVKAVYSNQWDVPSAPLTSSQPIAKHVYYSVTIYSLKNDEYQLSVCEQCQFDIYVAVTLIEQSHSLTI